jgi:hypothetical protein
MKELNHFRLPDMCNENHSLGVFLAYIFTVEHLKVILVNLFLVMCMFAITIMMTQLTFGMYGKLYFSL